MPLVATEPMFPFLEFLFDPEDEQETSYLAALLKILNFYEISI